MDKHICYECIGDKFVKSRIKSEGEIQKCSYCNQPREAINLSLLAEWIDDVYRENYTYGEEYPVIDQIGDGISYEIAGESPDDIISQMLEVDSDIAYDIVDILSGEEQYHVIAGGGLPLYDHTSYYEETPISSYRHSELWNEFCFKVKHQSRFYNIEATKILDSLFSQVILLQYIGEYPPIREIGPGTNSTFLYRARIIKNDIEIIKMRLEAYKELGPPPKSKATPGRMNAQGIPVFYGTTDSETCIAEIRLPVGGKAILAKFEIIKPLVVLDLTVFGNMYEILSLFDPEFEYKASRLKFLREFDQRISEPVLSNENAFDYIPTQALAEYLANHYEVKIDAVIYSSTQVEGESKNNIVILPHAASVEWPENIPILESKSPYRLIWFEDDCWIINTKNKNVRNVFILESDLDDLSSDYNISSEPTLRIVEDSISIVHAKSISYGIQSYELRDLHDEDDENDKDELL